ncbi:TPA: DUF6708 domain-containing protein [Pseudomonas aeruginosa]
MELHTSRFGGRGAGILLSAFTLATTSTWVAFLLSEIGITYLLGKPLFLVAIAGVLCLSAIFIVGGWRMDVEAPRDEPVRFNRKRRKVYVYRNHEGWAFSRKNWGVRPVVFNWDDLRAESWTRIAPTASGVPIVAWGVDVAVVEPGTHHVIDRFQLAGSNADGEHMWAMARAFMNQGPEALPKYPHPPRDWNNDVPWYNVPMRLAPKVEWPADIDRESRTAP